MTDKILPRERTVRTRLHTVAHVPGGVSVRDVIPGVSDGLTVPFALAAGLSGAELDQLVDAIIKDRHRWVEFMMHEELGMIEPAAGAAYVLLRLMSHG